MKTEDRVRQLEHALEECLSCLECSIVGHGKHELHAYDEACPVLERLNRVLKGETK